MMSGKLKEADAGIVKPPSYPSAFRFHGGPCLCSMLFVLVWLIAGAVQGQATNYVLGTTALLEGPAGGMDSVVLGVMPANGAWTATANTNWLHLTTANQSGDGSTNVVFTYDANPGPTRTGTLTIAGQTLTVTQAGSTYVAAAMLTTLVLPMFEPADTQGPFGSAVDGAGNVYTLFADDPLASSCWFVEWELTSNSPVQSGLPGFNIQNVAGNLLAADGAGDLYIADSGHSAVKEWTAADSNVTTLVSTGLNQPSGVAVDGAGNVYIADSGNAAIEEWTVADGNVTTLVSSGLNYPVGVAVDAAGNVYIADGNAILEWTEANSNLTTLVGSGLNQPLGVAVDGSGNVFINDTANFAIKKWTAANNSVSTLLSPTFSPPVGVAVDGTGNLYIANANYTTLEELPNAFVDPSARSESAAAGNDSLPEVLPATQNLLPPFAPTSDQGWLNITGITNGVVSFSFAANTGAVRTAFITLLGQSIPVTQAGVIFTVTSSLGTTTRLEGPTAGSDSVVLAVTPATGAWTNTAHAAWLHLSPANQIGIGSTNVIFAYDANPGATRTGTLTIAGQTLDVTQAGSTYVAAGIPTTLVSSGLRYPNGVAVDGAGNVYIADTDNSALKKWSPASDTVSTLVSSGLEFPEFVAVDGAGNVYAAEYGAILEWSEANSNLTTLVSSWSDSLGGLAVDAAGNAYFANYGNYSIQEWLPGNSDLATLVPPGLFDPIGVAVDAAGNVYSGDSESNVVKEWSPANNSVTTLFSSAPYGLAVDGAGNVYVINYTNNAVQEWSAASNTVSTLASLGMYLSQEPAVDGTGNVYFAAGDEIVELPRAFVDPTPRLESGAAGSDSLPAVLPITANLQPPFAPYKQATWLTITGVTNGVVSFSFTANTTGSPRTAYILLFDQNVPVTQGVIGTPPKLGGVQWLGNGALKFVFTDNPNASFTILSSTNLSLPLSNWTVVGTATNTAGDQFQFTSQPATNNTQLFYTVRSP
jgi:DNA-binding beta-propeller fold protein YncE